MRRWLTLVLGLAGCDRVFALEEVKRLPDGSVDIPIDAAACAYSQLDPNADDDSDGALNGMDKCPLVPSAPADDEDGDGSPDACDLCPQFMQAGNDVDCDGIGAACDPDDAIPHDRQFFGLSSGAGVVPYNATLQDGMARIVLTSTDGFGSLRAGPLTTSDGIVEATFRVSGTVGSGVEFSIGFVDAAFNSILRFEVESYSTDSWALNIVDRGVDQPEVPLVLTGNFQIRIRGSIEGGNLRAEVGDDAMASVSGAIAPLMIPVQLAVWAYRETAASSLTLEVLYMQQVRPRP